MRKKKEDGGVFYSCPKLCWRLAWVSFYGRCSTWRAGHLDQPGTGSLCVPGYIFNTCHLGTSSNCPAITSDKKQTLGIRITL